MTSDCGAIVLVEGRPSNGFKNTFDFEPDIDHWDDDRFEREADRDLWPYQYEEVGPRLPSYTYPDDQYPEYRLEYDEADHDEECREVLRQLDEDADNYLPRHSSARSLGSRKSFLIEHPFKDVRFSGRFHRNRHKKRWARVRAIRYDCARKMKDAIRAFNN